MYNCGPTPSAVIYIDLIVDLPMLRKMVHVAANNIGGT